MSGTFNLIKEFMSALNASEQNKTQPYDTQGTVKRVEGDTAWVQFTGSDRETPIQMTIACDVGDTVQARIGGGSAWLTGNLTAPPTDDKKANQAITMVTNVVQEIQETVDEALKDVSTVDDVTMQYCLSDSSSTFVQYGDWSNTPPTYVSGKYYWTRSVLVDDDGNETYGEPRYSQDTQLSVETDVAFKSNNNHFWHDSSGAYVTTTNKSYSTGSAVRITASGILQQVDGNTVSSWTNSGISFLQGGSTVASFGSGGISLYGNGYLGASITSSGVNLYADGSLGASITSSGMNVYASGGNVASFGSTARIGSTSSKNIEVSASGLDFKNGSTSVFRINNVTEYRIVNGVQRLYTFAKFYSPYQIRVDTDMYIDGDVDTTNVYAGGEIYASDGLDTGGTLGCDGVATFGSHIKPSDSSNNCGTSSNPWNNCYVSTYFASTTAPSSLSQDYAVAWHKTSSDNYVLCRPSSSRKWKKDIEPISDAIADPKKLYDVRVVQFRYKDKNADDPNNSKYNPTALDVGFIAEEVAEAYPLGAVINEDGEPDDWNARRIIPPMLALIQEQNKRITALEEKLS